eukprot:CAMPEP_0173433338 /NCGR_PEP_ID=MMETSP1357-20121228/10820_1 /TAXON_ID=77926 /ORGANISM="Hemiselmis rufescens, Strain PCC563" /LENGTH=255 /DNA_ID=CAMNT_0014398033 /DNA_START=35 /DNA_END=802 /DNA_ORIENTATION=+
MKPAPPPGWVNKMDEKDEGKKKKLDQGAQWHSGILGCASDPLACLLGCAAPCVLYGMAKAEVEESIPQNAMALLMGGCPCFTLCFFRENIRTRYAIEGSVWTDFLFASVLFPCTICQLYTHLRKKPLAAPVKNPAHQAWSSGLFNCHDDIPLCLLVCVGCCCAYGILKRKMGQDQATNASFGFIVGVPCVYGCANRGALRAKYGIKSNLVVDTAVWFAAPCCALCQEMRHIKRFPYVSKLQDASGRVVAAPTTSA